MKVSESISATKAHNESMRAAAGSSFYVAMRVLPVVQRQAMFEIYAFCHAVDDIADSNAPVAERRASLEQWQRDIDACYTGNTPLRLLNLQQHIMAFKLERDDFHAVIEGMLMDTNAVMCAPDADTLDIYCDRVASAAGRLSVKVFGMLREDGIALAHHLGRALQLTNILRDIDEDADIGRVYLPREALLAAGVVPGMSPAIITAHPAIPTVCAALAGQAQSHFQASEVIMSRSSCRLVRAPRMMAAAYHGLLMRLLKRGWARPGYPMKVSKLQKIGILLRYAFI